MFKQKEVTQEFTKSMEADLSSLKNIYDVLAYCCCCVYNMAIKFGIQFGDLVDGIEDADGEEVYDEIDQYCSNVVDFGQQSALSKLLEYLWNLIRTMKENKSNLCKFARIILEIDDQVPAEITRGGRRWQDIIEYNSLNQACIEQVRIIPKLREDELVYGDIDTDEIPFFRNKREEYNTQIDSFLSHYAIWDKENFEKTPFTIYHYCPQSKVAKKFRKKKSLSFGVFPLTNRPVNEVLDCRESKVCYFSVHGLTETAEEDIKKKYLQACMTSSEHDLDFLIFPEMLLTKDIVASFPKDVHLKPIFVINGSIWEDEKNICIVSNEKGEEIFSYFKKNAYTYPKGGVTIYENLDPEVNKKYEILEIENFGRISVAICKDLASNEVRNFHQKMGTNVLIVPSYTESMDLTYDSRFMAAGFHCIVILANSCSAVSKKGDINKGKKTGFVCTPAKNGTERAGYVYYYSQTKCHENCSNMCEGKYVKINFEVRKQYDSSISYLISEI